MNQIPPVNEVKSVALSTPNIFKLDKIVRQSYTNPLSELIELILKDISNADGNNRTNYFYDRVHSSTLPKKNITNGEGFEIITDGKEFVNLLYEYMQSEKSLNSNVYCKYIAWTNDNLSLVNKNVRNKVLGTSDIISVGDVLMAYNTLSVQDKIFKDVVPIITNSEDYKVIECVRFEDIKTIRDKDLSQKYFKVKLKNLDNDVASIVNCNILVKDWDKFATCIDDVPDFYYELSFLLNQAIQYGRTDKRKWAQYYDFKNRKLILTPLKETLDKDSKLILKKDVDYAYGISVHKSQGSTYDTIFVNLKNIMNNPNVAERFRLIYVAISRTKNKCYLYI